MHNKKGGKGIKKKSYNKRMNLTEAQSSEMAMKNLINLRKNKHIITVDHVLKLHKIPTEEINIRDRKFGGIYEDPEIPADKLTDKSAKAFHKEFGKVVEAADVIIEVLDARDPMGTRCQEIERSINLKSKTLVLLLNKADLVPRDNLRKWLKVLKKEYSTVVFKSNTQLQTKRLGRLGTKAHLLGEDFTTSRCVGADTLMQLLRSIRLSKEKADISVGVVGLPNVGKSSVINSMKRSRACNVGAVPGITKHMQEVTIDSKIHLIDCPGLIFGTGDSSDAMYALRNAIKTDSLDDPVTPVEAILTKAGYDKMSAHYNIGEIKDTSHFLSTLAKRRGKLLKQGLPDINAAAAIILNDWNSGKIKYFSDPPCINGDAYITDAEEAIFLSLPNPKTNKLISLGGVSDMEIDNDTIVEDSGLISASAHIIPDVTKVAVVAPVVKKPRWETKHKQVDISSMDIRKVRKKDLKKLNRERRRNLKKADEVTDALEAFNGLNDVHVNEDDMIDIDL